MKIARTLITTGILSIAAAVPATAQESGDWQIRFGAGYISPDTSRDELVFESTQLADFNIDVDDQIGLVFDLTYFLSPNFALELLGSTPFKHDIDGAGTLSALGNIGDTKHLAPTLSLQYHFSPNQTVRPYVGAGLNYTLFFDDSTNARLHQGVVATANEALGADFSGGNTNLSIDGSAGPALQAGLDVNLPDNWFWNFNIRYILIDADADLKTTTFGPDGIETVFKSNINVAIDPFVYSTQLGFRF